jgi:hypothetical protein
MLANDYSVPIPILMAAGDTPVFRSAAVLSADR